MKRRKGPERDVTMIELIHITFMLGKRIHVSCESGLTYTGHLIGVEPNRVILDDASVRAADGTLLVPPVHNLSVKIPFSSIDLFSLADK